MISIIKLFLIPFVSLRNSGMEIQVSENDYSYINKQIKFLILQIPKFLTRVYEKIFKIL